MRGSLTPASTFFGLISKASKSRPATTRITSNAHQHQINIRIITFFLSVVWIFLRYWLLSSSRGGTKVKTFQSISGKAWESSKVTQATSSWESKAGRKPTLYTSNQNCIRSHARHTGKLWNSHVWQTTPSHPRKAYQPWGTVWRGAADHHQIFLHVQQRPAANVRL